ncbi:MAG: PrgI family protein [Candidatus Paceibacterota bacterium]
MQFSVPQFIDVEDKIVGPFTGKQTIYLIAGGGVILFAFTFFNFFFFLVIMALIAPLTLAFAFYRPKGISMSRYLGNRLDFFTSNHLYVWRREPMITLYKTVQKKHTSTETPMKTVSKSRIRDLANLLDTSAEINLTYEAKTRPDENIFRK